MIMTAMIMTATIAAGASCSTCSARTEDGWTSLRVQRRAWCRGDRGNAFAVAVHRQRRRLRGHQVVVPSTKFLWRDPSGCGELRQLVGLVEIIAPQAAHVPGRAGNARQSH